MSKSTEKEYCRKCETWYEKPFEEHFYWETRQGWWRKPCKKCISKYNKEQREKNKK